MILYDISQEVFSCAVYPGDPAPRRERICAIGAGSVCNLTAFSMCAHNGTHIDAPAHFLAEGKTVSEISLDAVVGPAYVIEAVGVLSENDVEPLLSHARAVDPDAARRILLKGEVNVSTAAARAFAAAGILLLGVESQSVGDEGAPMAAHLALLSAGVVLLEGIRLSAVPEGAYLLSAAPLHLGGADGAPCRAILIGM